MNDANKSSIQNEITARLVAEAEATIRRDMAEFERIALKYNIGVDTFVSILKNARPESSWNLADLKPLNPLPSQSSSSSLLPLDLKPPAPAFDGTFRGLMDVYRAHEKSPFHQIKYSVRLNYERSFKRLEREIGGDRIDDWSADTINKQHEVWKAGGKLAMAHDLITKLRLLTSFGSTVLNDDDCIRLNLILSNMRFPISKGSVLQRLTREQARAIRITAREHFGWDSIALATALQFELPKLRLMDIIGEWVPLLDTAEPGIVKGSEKWIRGLMWSDLNDSFILRRPPSRSGKPVEYSLRRSQMSMEEINRVPVERRKGPMIICEFSGIPWSPNEYRRKLRIVADKAGVPLLGYQPAKNDEELELDEDVEL